MTINLVPLLLLLGGLVSLVLAWFNLRTTATTASVTLGVLSLLFGVLFGTTGAVLLFALLVRAP